MNTEKLMKLGQRMLKIRHEAHYDQGRYVAETACGTTGCLAYHALAMERWRVKIDGKDVTIAKPGETFKDAKKSWRSIRDAAAEILGLTDDEAEALFDTTTGYTWPEEYADMFAHEIHSPDGRPSRVAGRMLIALAMGEVTLETL